MTKQIVKSLFIVFLISISVGGITVLFYPSLTTFLKVIIGLTGFQIVFFFIYNNILRYITRLNLEKEALFLSQLAEQNRSLVECQKCKAMNNVYINFTEENTFTCEECNADNRIEININTILLTKMIYDK